MTVSIGSAIGPYRIDARLGEGGMGAVYRAFDERLHRQVAIKVLPALDSGSAEARARMMREARAAAALSHPNIVTVYDVGEHDGMPYIAMELVEGQSLRAFVGDPNVTDKRKLRWLTEIARALDAAHKRGLVHRDIKPENVVIASENDSAKVLDFGIARRASTTDPLAETGMAGIETITTKGVAIGTPLYMAPEQVRGEDVDARADQFAWGVLAYELMSGSTPWKNARDAMSLAAAITSQTPDPLNSEIGPVIMRALSKRPRERFASMADLVAATDAPAAAPRRRTIHPVGVALALAVVIAGGAALVARTRHRDAKPAVASPAPLPSVVTLLDLPGSTSKNPAAVSAYRSAILALHDGNWVATMDWLEKAHQLDESDALILARRAIIAALSRNQSTADRRARFIAAHGVRDRLSARDAGLLIAVEPLAMRDPLDFDEALARLEKLVREYPTDAELRSLIGDVANDAGKPTLAIPYLEEAVRLDPKHSDNYQSLAESKRALDDVDGALATLNECTVQVPGSGDCRVLLTMMLDAAGRCGDAELAAKQALALQPTQTQILSYRAGLLFALGQGPDVVRTALEARWAALSPLDRTYATALDEARLAAVSGDLGSAHKSATAASEALAKSSDSRAHGEVAELAASLALEVGDDKRADAIAATFMARSTVWPAPPRFTGDPAPVLLAIRRAVNGITDQQVSAQRDAWIAKWRLDVAKNVGHWAAAYATVAVDQELAREALAAAPVSAKLRTHDPRLDAMIGRTLFLSGRSTEATILLRDSVRSCRVLNHPFLLTRAQLWLAEATADHDEACRALGVVIMRFGNEPRSVTARRARELGKKLACSL